MKKKFYPIEKALKQKAYTVILAEGGTGQKMCESDALFSMYSHYEEKIRQFNQFNDIVFNVSKYQSHRKLDTEISVNREMFDKLYEGALLLKLPIDMTFNYDTDMWYLCIKYKNHDLCFTHNDN